MTVKYYDRNQVSVWFNGQKIGASADGRRLEVWATRPVVGWDKETIIHFAGESVFFTPVYYVSHPVHHKGAGRYMEHVRR